MNKRGSEYLLENIVFLGLVLFFFAVCTLFIMRSGGGAIVAEESYAKKIALLIDYSKPVMEMSLNMEDAFKIAKENKIPREEIVKIEGNTIQVKLSSKSGYKYSFFNSVSVAVYPDENLVNCIIKINGYNENA